MRYRLKKKSIFKHFPRLLLNRFVSDRSRFIDDSIIIGNADTDLSINKLPSDWNYFKRVWI